MPTYTDPGLIGSGAVVPSTHFNIQRDNAALFARPPGCIAQRTTNQSAGNGAATAIPLNATDLRDTDNFHNPASSPERITIPTGLGGLYRVEWGMAFASNASGYRDGVIRINGSTSVNPTRIRVPAASGVATFIGSSGLLTLNAGDYIELLAQQNSGGALDVSNAQVGLTMVAWA